VVDKDMASNTLIVDQGDTDLLLSEKLLASKASWIGTPPRKLAEGYRCMARIRYRQRDQSCTVVAEPEDALLVTFDDCQRAVAPGQFVVFYAADRCLGGAVIDQIDKPLQAPSAIMRPPGGLAGHG